MKFVDEGPKIRRSTRKDKLSVRALSLKTAVGRADQDNGDAIRRYRIAKPDVRDQPSSLKAERDQILSAFVSAMFPLGSATVQTSFLGSWLWHLPPRLGSSAVLDYAALSVSWAYFAKLYGDPLALRKAENAYACAVKGLALALGDEKQQLSENVLCATVLLGHFEVWSHNLIWSSDS
jgi:hypothetical protein